MEKLTFVTDDNDNVDLYIIEETRANGINYLLVSDSDDEEDDSLLSLESLSLSLLLAIVIISFSKVSAAPTVWA